MHTQIDKYLTKLVQDDSAQESDIGFAAQDDVMITGGDVTLAALAGATLSRLNCLALIVAKPQLPFIDFLIARSKQNEREIFPQDTETRTFLHDIPIIRSQEIGEDLSTHIATLLGSRKGIVVEGLGIVAAGALTVEQTYINWCSVFHSTYIKYLQDLLENGFKVPGEAVAFARFRQKLPPLSMEGLQFLTGPLTERQVILEEMTRVGRYTVQQRLVDSFFGNISCVSGQSIYISQTASSLDELAGCIDPVPFENSSTVAITASSELVAHRAIFLATGCRTILHGHPRFAVVMSMLCGDKATCHITDCWRDCDKVRFIGTTPVVAGEIGAGGIAKKVPPVISGTGSAIVYGHGIFCIGMTDFRQAFEAMVTIENRCREEYFALLDRRTGRSH